MESIVTNQAKPIFVPTVKEFRENYANFKSFSLRLLADRMVSQAAQQWQVEHDDKVYHIEIAGKSIYPLAIFKHNNSRYLVSLNCAEIHPNLAVLELDNAAATPIIDNEKVLAKQFKNAELMNLLRFISHDLFYLDFTDHYAPLDLQSTAKTYEVNTLLCSVKFTGELVESKDGVDSYDIMVKGVKQRFVHDKVNDQYNFLGTA